MADNVTITAGAGTTIAADDVGGALHQRVKLVLGDDGTAVDAKSASSQLLVSGVIGVVSANFTRPSDTTAYASADLVANSTTAGSVTPLSFSAARYSGGSGMIRRARLLKTATSITNASFRLHLYGSSPTVTNGDNAAWLSITADYLGSIDFIFGVTFSDDAMAVGVPSVGSEIPFIPASGSTIYGLLEARGAYTPASAEVFTVYLDVMQN